MADKRCVLSTRRNIVGVGEKVKGGTKICACDLAIPLVWLRAFRRLRSSRLRPTNHRLTEPRGFGGAQRRNEERTTICLEPVASRNVAARSFAVRNARRHARPPFEKRAMVAAMQDDGSDRDSFEIFQRAVAFSGQANAHSSLGLGDHERPAVSSTYRTWIGSCLGDDGGERSARSTGQLAQSLTDKRGHDDSLHPKE